MTETMPAPGTVAYLAKHGGEPGRAFGEYVKSLHSDETLTRRETELVFIGVQTALNLEDSLKAHIPRALAAGLSKAEVAAAMMIAMANGGVNGALRGLPMLLETQLGPADVARVADAGERPGDGARSVT